MTYVILPSRRFQKAAKKYAKAGLKRVLENAADAVDLLAIHDDRSLYTLRSRWRDHELKGNKKGIRELHLGQDELLLYAIDEDQLIVKLLDIVNHEGLKKKWQLSSSPETPPSSLPAGRQAKPKQIVT